MKLKHKLPARDMYQNDNLCLLLLSFSFLYFGEFLCIYLVHKCIIINNIQLIYNII